MKRKIIRIRPECGDFCNRSEKRRFLGQYAKILWGFIFLFLSYNAVGENKVSGTSSTQIIEQSNAAVLALTYLNYNNCLQVPLLVKTKMVSGNKYMISFFKIVDSDYKKIKLLATVEIDRQNGIKFTKAVSIGVSPLDQATSNAIIMAAQVRGLMEMCVIKATEADHGEKAISISKFPAVPGGDTLYIITDQRIKWIRGK